MCSLHMVPGAVLSYWYRSHNAKELTVRELGCNSAIKTHIPGSLDVYVPTGRGLPYQVLVSVLGLSLDVGLLLENLQLHGNYFMDGHALGMHVFGDGAYR